MNQCPDCGKPCKGTRGVSVHQNAGCPVVITNMFKDGYSMGDLAEKFGKRKLSIEQIIRVEGIKRNRNKEGV